MPGITADCFKDKTLDCQLYEILSAIDASGGSVVPPHKATHAIGGTDAISPADIGAVASVPADTVPITTIRALTQAEYDALTPPDPNTFYAIV